MAGFDDAPAVHEEDVIGPRDRFDAMGDDEGGAVTEGGEGGGNGDFVERV